MWREPVRSSNCSCQVEGKFEGADAAGIVRFTVQGMGSTSVHVRFSEGLGVRFPRATRPDRPYGHRATSRLYL